MSHVQSIVQQLLACVQSSTLLFWFECALILAPTFVCHPSLSWKSTDCNHLTGSHKSQHKPRYRTLSRERRTSSPHPSSAQAAGTVNNSRSGRICFACGHFERRLWIGSKADPNIDLCFTSGVFHQVPIKASSLIQSQSAGNGCSVSYRERPRHISFSKRCPDRSHYKTNDQRVLHWWQGPCCNQHKYMLPWTPADTQPRLIMRVKSSDQAL